MLKLEPLTITMTPSISSTPLKVFNHCSRMLRYQPFLIHHHRYHCYCWYRLFCKCLHQYFKFWTKYCVFLILLSSTIDFEWVRFCKNNFKISWMWMKLCSTNTSDWRFVRYSTHANVRHRWHDNCDYTQLRRFLILLSVVDS